MCGVRCADPIRAAAVTARAFKKGLIIERSGPRDEVIKCMMPLTTRYSELDEGLAILEGAMEEEFHSRPSGQRRRRLVAKLGHHPVQQDSAVA